MGLLKKLWLVLWKNLIIRRRHWILTSIEIVIPVLLFIVVAVVRSEIGPSDDVLHPMQYYDIWTEDTIIEQSMTSLSDTSLLLYAPHNNFTKRMMTVVSSRLKKQGSLGFESEDELINYYESLNDTHRDIYAVIFEGLPTDGDPGHLKYKIRLSDPKVQTSLIFDEFQSNGPGFSGESYYHSNFLAFQLLLDKTFIAMTGTEPSSYKLNLQQFPYPAYHQDDFVSIFTSILPFCTVISFVMLCPAILKRVVEEKQTGVKELMKMMGLKSWMLWFGWMINALLVNFVSVTIIVILMKAQFNEVSVLQYSNGFLVWIYLLLYCAAGVTFCFAISAFFSRPNLAMSVGVILWFLTNSATFSYVMSNSYIAPYIKLLSALLPNTAITWGYRIIVAYESKKVGVTWMNLFEPPSGIKGDISLGLVLLMFIVDIFIYSFVTWYISSIMPGQYGLAKPWYFIFMPSYWRNSKVNNMEVTSDNDTVSSKKFEKPHGNLSVGIKIRNLYKVFQSYGGLNKKVAVDGVTLDIYSGEITALLGHNGAGKTTVMSILTGLFSPTSGSVHINGYNIRDNLDEVRESLGLCPQHNLLFTDLTVLEHLLFFAMLKGSSRSEANNEARNLLQKLNLEDKRNKLCSTLSGGMKRKLSLGIALIGDTKVLMLDEPTSGMDPEARREIWDVLLNMRGQRTILITTHYMEEADVLGDRIAIMDHGRVQCYGTTLFLKKLYGTGYQLNLLKNEGCHVAKITNTIKPIIPDVKVKSEMGSLLCYMLPSEQRNNFPRLFDILEQNKQQLCISGIGVSITTLEEVFLRVGKEAVDELDGQTNSESDVEYTKLYGSSEALTFKKMFGASLLEQQLRALFTKRVIFTCRKWLTFLLQALIPIVMTFLTVILTANTGGTSEPARVINLNDYGATNVLYSVNESPVGWNDTYEELVKLTGSSVMEVEDVCASLLLAGESDMQKYRTEFIIAAEFNSSSSGAGMLNAMFSSTAIHSAPISLNVLTNAVLKTNSKEKSITAINHPLPSREHVSGEGFVRQIGVMVLWMTLMPFGLLFLTGSFMTFPLLERVSKAKQLQLMTGTSPLAYWFTCFAWDLLLYMIVAIIMMFVVLIADPLNVFNGSEELGTYFLLLMMYGLSAIPFAYLFSHFRNTSAGAFSLLVVLNVLVGLIMFLVVYFMLLSEDYKSTGKVLKFFFEFIPHFTITYAFTRFSDRVLSNNQCRLKKSYCNSISSTLDICCSPDCKDGYCPAIYKPYLAFADNNNENAVGGEILYMAVDSLIYFSLIMLVEFGVFGILYEKVKKIVIGNKVDKPLLDDDVVHEQDRVDGQIKVAAVRRDDDIMLVHNLVKKFTRNLTAVKSVSFGVAPGECFGLLGVNGAGKTTIFRMLTGDETPTEGEAWIGQYSLSKDKSEFLAQIGYCPQFDAINEALTGREMLKLFASLRGVSKNNIEYEVKKWITLMGLQEYENRKCGTYSGGNKRKLSTAMALIGNPPIVFLDEPTSGVDPVARRNLWTVLTSIQKSGQSVVLTSHSMEECEALCNRLAIMVAGQFVCMGGVQYLKQKFGQGFTIMVKLRAVEADKPIIRRLKREIKGNFSSGCVLKDEHQGLLHYHVTDPSTPWKHLFTTMEYVKHKYDLVEDYVVSETTLEQVFISFAKSQNGQSAGPNISISA
ncbi:ATP-binding cassette sub-family A member 3 [Cryptotermes secundus]|uniref:ATP-binding cassette sub-family A member 3 n=1 Tax=Cryptotermes secundus TaxID=105785 RepID=A0A2J7RIF3_9NEOP|nr:phospholipid-transporting ATPase ABCA1 isoform X3 [Cryptotermes secundus]PNF40610.1 ATP-binding cassette sub-family A member 3 [Cryptotermes secundus]